MSRGRRPQRSLFAAFVASVICFTGTATSQGVGARVASPGAIPLECQSKATQGGVIVCRTAPGSQLSLDGRAWARADAKGVAVLGLTRQQKTPARVSVTGPSGAVGPSFRVNIQRRKDTVSSIPMECNKIRAQSDEEKLKAEQSWLKKQAALAVFNEPPADLSLDDPVAGDFPYSSSFGATRTYVPKTKDCKPTVNVHNGTDIAVPTGTPIVAPASGVVILADPDLYYEGGCVFLDLGRGLVSVTMHMSRIDVQAGQLVRQGEPLGLSGATGRVTGPHLHWAIKYRNVFETDRASDIWLDPRLVLHVQPPAN